jgi:murein DD-endopeptidase MepM/ murein hydrolase activator NlpD
VADIRGIGKGSIGGGGGSPEIYKVRKGDTLEGIAKQYGVSSDAILKINRHIKGTSLRAGETLNIPVKESGKTLTPSSKSVLPGAPLKKALRTPSASKTGDASPYKPAGDALPFKVAPDGVLYRAGDALPDKQVGDALAFRAGNALPDKQAGDALAFKAGDALPDKQVGDALAFKAGDALPDKQAGDALAFRAGEALSFKYDAGDAFSHKFRAGDASASLAPGEALQGKIRAGEAEGIIGQAGKVREVKLTPDQFQINKDGNLVIKNQDLIATFKALGKSTGAGETQAVLINLTNSKLKDE